MRRPDVTGNIAEHRRWELAAEAATAAAGEKKAVTVAGDGAHGSGGAAEAGGKVAINVGCAYAGRR